MISEFLDNLPQRLKAARVAVLAIDQQYLFRSLIAQRIGEEKTKDGFDRFSAHYTKSLCDFRDVGLPIVHVAFSRADFPTYAHLPGDRIFEKPHVSAFHDGMLDVALRAACIDTLIVTELYAEECVDETLCDARSLGYDCAVVTDMVFSAEELIDLEENKRLVAALFQNRNIPTPLTHASQFHTACTRPAQIFALS